MSKTVCLYSSQSRDQSWDWPFSIPGLENGPVIAVASYETFAAELSACLTLSVLTIFVISAVLVMLLDLFSSAKLTLFHSKVSHQTRINNSVRSQLILSYLTA